MKTIEMTVPVNVTKEISFNIKSSFEVPVTVEEISSSFTPEEALRIFYTGLRMIKRNEVRANHNFGPIAKKLHEMGLFPSIQEALDMLLLKKGLK